MSKIFITGDLHRDIDINKLHIFQESHKNLTKEDYVIILGDFGGILYDYQSDLDKEFLKRFDNYSWTTLWLDGNHENFDALEKYPVTMWNGGRVQKITDSVIHLMRGQVYEIYGMSFFVMGGAASLDKMFRVPHKSWWPQEIPTQEEMEQGLLNLEKVESKVDYVLTHACGSDVFQAGNGFPLTDNVGDEELVHFFDLLDREHWIEYKHWYFGHHHQDRDFTNKHTCVYNDIIELVP